MKLLLDTHALLALISSDYELSPDARAAIDRSDNRLLASAVNVWEIAIKRAIGKLEAPGDLLDRLEETGAEVLAITARHAHATGELPPHHHDPFDRLLIAQALLEGCTLITADRKIAAYDIAILW